MSNSVEVSIRVLGDSAEHARDDLRRTLKGMGFVPKDEDAVLYLTKLCDAVRAIYGVEPRDLVKRYDEAAVSAISNLRPEAPSGTPS